MEAIHSLAESLDRADFVLWNGEVFATEYARVPDEDTRAEDVVLEARHGDSELSLTLADIDEAEALGEGVYRLKSGELLRLLSHVTVH
jgi:hypothetical protein